MAVEPKTLRDDVRISAADLREIAREAAERAARKVRADDIEAVVRATIIKVLQELGLADAEGKVAEAGYDLRDLRQLMQMIRAVRKRLFMALIAIAIGVGVPVAIAKLKGLL